MCFVWAGCLTLYGTKLLEIMWYSVSLFGGKSPGPDAGFGMMIWQEDENEIRFILDGRPSKQLHGVVKKIIHALYSKVLLPWIMVRNEAGKMPQSMWSVLLDHWMKADHTKNQQMILWRQDYRADERTLMVCRKCLGRFSCSTKIRQNGSISMASTLTWSLCRVEGASEKVACGKNSSFWNEPISAALSEKVNMIKTTNGLLWRIWGRRESACSNLWLFCTVLPPAGRI